MRISNKNMTYNSIVELLGENDRLIFDKRVKTNHGSLRGITTNKLFHYGIISKVGEKDKKVNLRLFNTNSLEAIEKGLINQLQE